VRRIRIACVVASIAVAATSAAFVLPVQERGDPAAVMAAQKEALKRFACLDGHWRGSAWMILPNGEKHEVTQTERVGPLLDGAVRVIEGRGYEADGKTGFNAFAILSWSQDKESFSMRSYAQGRVGDFVVTPTANGFSWEIPAGPTTIKYTAVIEGDDWSEVGEQSVQGKEPFRFLEMKLKRIGPTEWPAGGAVPMK